MATKKSGKKSTHFRKKSIKEVKDKIYEVKRDYLWLPVKLADKNVRVIPVNLADIEIIGKERLNKIHKVRYKPRVINTARVYIGKAFIGRKVRLKEV